MAAWTQSIPLIPPAALAPLLGNLADLADAANDTLDIAGAALDAAKVLLAGTVSPQAAAAQAQLAVAKGILNDTFGAGVYPLTVHPWQPGVGHGTGLGINLSFPNAVRAIVQSFDDHGDKHRPQFSSAAEVAMIVMIAGAPSPSIFKQVVQAVRALIDLPALRLVERRIQQAIDHDRNRWTLPSGSKLPDWGPPTTVLSVFPGLRPLYDSLRAAIATLEGYARGANKAVDIASDLIDLKRAQLTALQNRLNAAAALFGGGLENAGAYMVKIEGEGGYKFLQEQLAAATGAPGHELSLCVGTAWVASPAELQSLGAVLGLI